MTGQAPSSLVYVTLFLTCCAGIAELSWWAACVGAGALALISLVGRQLISENGAAYRLDTSDASLAISSLISASAAGSAAFVLGRASAWLWGF